MKTKKRSAGRPAFMNEPTVVRGFNITENQADWISSQSDQKGMSASEFLRKLIEDARKSERSSAGN